MTVFVTLAALMFLLALFFLLSALVRGESAPAEHSPRWLPVGLALAFSIMTVCVYNAVGTPNALGRPAESPSTIEALAMEGGARFKLQDYAGAVRLWRQVLSQVPENSNVARAIADSIAKAESLAAQSAAKQ